MHSPSTYPLPTANITSSLTLAFCGSDSEVQFWPTGGDAEHQAELVSDLVVNATSLKQDAVCYLLPYKPVAKTRLEGRRK